MNTSPNPFGRGEQPPHTMVAEPSFGEAQTREPTGPTVTMPPAPPVGNHVSQPHPLRSVPRPAAPTGLGVAEAHAREVAAVAARQGTEERTDIVGPVAVPGDPQALFAGLHYPPMAGTDSSGRRGRPVAKSGWRKVVAKSSSGLVNPGPGQKEQRHEALLDKIRGSLAGVDKVAFGSAKGGVGKSTMAVAVGSAIARERGDRVIAVDVDTDLGDLIWRFREHGGQRANIEHLAGLRDSGRYSRVREHMVQNADRLEALSSQNDPRSTYTLNPRDYRAAMQILETHYNVVLLDCGTSITTPLFSTIANDVTGLVVVASQNTRGIMGARNTLYWLYSHGYGKLLQHTVVVLNATDRGRSLVDLKAVEAMFRRIVPDVIQMPYDPHLAAGTAVAHDGLHRRTRKALLSVAGAVADHYPRPNDGAHAEPVMLRSA